LCWETARAWSCATEEERAMTWEVMSLKASEEVRSSSTPALLDEESREVRESACCEPESDAAEELDLAEEVEGLWRRLERVVLMVVS
jgi:hypothetical protein